MGDDYRSAVLRSVRLVDVVGETTPLVPVTEGYRGRCMYHPDQTLSLYVSSSPAIFHCFACGAGGDAVTWTMHRYGVDEESALARLASSSGSPPGAQP